MMKSIFGRFGFKIFGTEEPKPDEVPMGPHVKIYLTSYSKIGDDIAIALDLRGISEIESFIDKQIEDLQALRYAAIKAFQKAER